MMDLRRRMIADLQRAGYSQKPPQIYLMALLGLAKYYMRLPDELSEEEVRAFFLHLRRPKARRVIQIRTLKWPLFCVRNISPREDDDKIDAAEGQKNSDIIRREGEHA